MLSLLLDEHISPTVAAGLRRRLPERKVNALAEWQGGNFLGMDDATCLRAAALEGRTLVTYDRRTIPPVLKLWAETGVQHGGVIFVDEKTVPPNDIGGLVHALAALSEQMGELDWTDRVSFLRR